MASLFQDQAIPEKTLLRKRLAESFDYGPENSKRSRNARLMAAARYLPKESNDKHKALGEDAYFICDDENTIGVADGVGGFTLQGVDSGRYARELMDRADYFILDESADGVDPMRALDYAFENNLERGASTACIITLKDNCLHAVNLGDSGFMVIRGGEIVYRSSAQQSRFNCPYQLGESSRHTPSDADKIVFEVELGDVVVAATDGLFDNLFDEQIEDVVSSLILTAEPPEAVGLVASKLVREARKVSLDRKSVTPFTMSAVDHGLDKARYMGGKYDDVTAIVGLIY